MQLKHEDFEKALQVQNILEKYYYKSHTVADLAQMVGTNKSTLNAAFKANTGMPVKTYLNYLRIEKARQLLETSDMSVKIIAGRMGLHMTNLEKNFKKRYGVSPKEWRRNPGVINHL